MNANDSSSYLSLISPEYLEQLRLQYEVNPQNVPTTWRLFFDGMTFGRVSEAEETENASAQSQTVARQPTATAPAAAATPSTANYMSQLKLLQLIDNYRRYGHLFSQLSPLVNGLKTTQAFVGPTAFQSTGISPAERLNGSEKLLSGLNVSELEVHLKSTYSGNIGAEFMYIEDERIRNWMAERLERVQGRPQWSREDKIEFLKRVTQAEVFETFLQKNYTGQKRFSLEGGEALVPALDVIHKHFADNGGKEVVIGMAHRGRLNVLTNVMKKPYSAIFAEFEGLKKSDSNGGDVKYHMGFSSDLQFGNNQLHLSLAFNPSHLEAVNAVVEGMSRAKQQRTYDGDYSKVLPVLIHGDAAAVGQGVVVETMNLANLDGYRTGGSIHIVINNQVGFTTNPTEARSGTYCTDFAKGIQAPILHVNGNKPEHVALAAQIAAEFRVKFQKDFFIDIYCYRKYGHNEGDEPRFTQPKMYNEIGTLKSPRTEYGEDLVREKTVTEQEVIKIVMDFTKALDQDLAEIKKGQIPDPLKPFRGIWDGLRTGSESELLADAPTSLSDAQFDKIIQTIHGPFGEVEALPKLAKMLEARRELVTKNDTIDWAVGEQLAFGSLLMDGYNVRISGQDCRRGTFSHRHVEIVDHRNENRIMPLRSLQTSGSFFSAWNSPLSEFAVMGFDYGFSLADPKTLVLWEGQFGDFANGAQIVIDQFIAASEKKWNRNSGFTLLLPHGYEGQGPEHSSARLERFLQLCADANMQVCYPTTPAQMCHLLRRQMMRPFRKPLIVMTPKSPLRMPEVVSKRVDFTAGHFNNLLFSGCDLAAAERVIFCSGKVYWDLLKTAKTLGREATTAFVRLEQIYPLDKEQIRAKIALATNAQEFVWCQEEPQNNGAWSFVALDLQDVVSLRYAGRKASASPATGYLKVHQAEQEALLLSAFTLPGAAP